MSMIPILTERDLKQNQKILIIDKIENLCDLSQINSLSGGRDLVIIMENPTQIWNHPKFERINLKKKFRLFSWNVFSYEAQMEVHDKACETVEKVYTSLKMRRKIPYSSIAKLYGHEDVQLALKKILIERLQLFFELCKCFGYFSNAGHSVLLFPSFEWLEIEDWIEQAGIDITPQMSIQNNEIIKRPTSFRIKINKSFKRICSFLFFPAAIMFILAQMRKIKYKDIPKNIQLCIRVYNNDWGLHRGRDTIKVDWPLDHKQLHSGSTIFVAETPLERSYSEEFEKYGYELIDLSLRNAFREMSLSFIWRKLFLNAFVSLPHLFIDTLFCSDRFIKFAAESWVDLLRWELFLEDWKPKKYLVYQSVDSRHIFRNIILKRNGCEMLFYNNSNSSNNVYQYKHKISGRHVNWSFLKYDVEFHWGVHQTELFKNNFGHSSSYLALGPLLSGVVNLSSEHKNFVENAIKGLPPGPIIAVFNTRFGGGGVNRDIDHLKFLVGVSNLLKLDKLCGLKILFKSKSEFSEYFESDDPEISKLSKFLAENPRFIIIDNSISAESVIFFADFVLCMAFASPGIEGLFNYKPTVYYDACNRYPFSYFDCFIDLVAHDEEKMVQLCLMWMGKTTSEVKEYVNQNILPKYGGVPKKQPVELIREKLLT